MMLTVVTASNILLRVLAKAIRQEKEVEVPKPEKHEFKLPLFIADLITSLSLTTFLMKPTGYK